MQAACIPPESDKTRNVKYWYNRIWWNLIKPSSQNWKLLSYAGLCATAWPTVFLWNIWFLLALGHFNISQWESPVNNSSESKFLDSGRLDYPTPAPCILDNFGQAISCRSWGIRRSSCKGKKFSDRFRWAKESCAHFASRLSLGNLASGLLSTGKYSKCPGIRLQVNSWRAEREVAEVQRNVSQKWNTLQKKNSSNRRGWLSKHFSGSLFVLGFEARPNHCGTSGNFSIHHLGVFYKWYYKNI